ncbi:MAG: TadE/TadG family type IV pilus assembly protein [Pontimonas sp.]
MTGRQVRDKGSASVEMVLITPLLVIFVLFVIFGGRSVESSSDVKHAADQGARAASMVATSRMPNAARRAAEADLVARRVSCPIPKIDVRTSQDGRTVTVTVSCRADSRGLDLLGVSTRSMTASSTEVVDRYRTGE